MLRIIGSSSSLACGIVKNKIAISVWRGKPSMPDFDIQYGAINQVVEKNPGKCAFLSIIEQTSPRPSKEFEQCATRMFHNFGKRLSAVGYIMEGSDIRRAFVIAIMTSITVLKSTPQPTQAFTDLHSAEKWFRDHLHLREAISLFEAIEKVRSAIQSSSGVMQ
jgi:hypothetical protein